MPSSLPKAHILGKFKKELTADGLYKAGPPPSHEDAWLLRFLRARKFKLPEAKLMFAESERWRKEFDVDELYATFDYHEKAEVDKIYPQYYHRTDKDGRPVYIEQLGNLDLTKLYAVTTPERQIQRLVVEYEKFLRERLPVCTAWRNDGELVETSCTIMDLNGVGISQFWKVKNYVQQATKIGQDRYPETMGKFYVINAPWAFTTVWSFVKPWLDEVTVRKINIVAHHSVKSELLAQIDAASLPAQFGGKCQCAGGCSMSDAGPWKDVAEGRLKLDSDAAKQAGVPDSIVAGGSNSSVKSPAKTAPSSQAGTAPASRAGTANSSPAKNAGTAPPTPAKGGAGNSAPSSPAQPQVGAMSNAPQAPHKSVPEANGSSSTRAADDKPQRSATQDSRKFSNPPPEVGGAPGPDSPATASNGTASSNLADKIPASYSSENLAIKRVSPTS